MALTITKELFEQYVPAFLSPDDAIFQQISGELQQAQQEVEEIIADTPIPPLTQQHAQRLVCLKAARQAVPQLDLVLTATGFGVVSNQNVAPASRERVDRLLEQLRKKESIATDRLLFSLLTTPWRNSTQATRRITSLIWCPSLLRSYGAKPNGQEVYQEEFLALQPAIADAEAYIIQLISGALYQELVRQERQPSKTDPEVYYIITEQARRLMAAIIAGHSLKSLQPLHNRLLNTIQDFANTLQPWLQSSNAAALKAEPYKNSPNDKTFFFS